MLFTPKIKKRLFRIIWVTLVVLVALSMILFLVAPFGLILF